MQRVESGVQFGDHSQGQAAQGQVAGNDRGYTEIIT